MNPVPENELLSAYLDGELTAGEQAQVEQLLATSPAARQLVDDLRALRVGLQALPAHRIGKDISQEVLRRAQLRMESEAAPPRPRREEREESPQAESPFWRTLLGRAIRPRALVWSGLAVSVAVVLFVVESTRDRGPGDASVAMRTSTAEAELEAPSMASTEAGSEASDEMADERRALGEAVSEYEYARGRRPFGFRRREPSEPAAEAVMDAPYAAVRPTAKDGEEGAVAEKPASLPLVAKGAQEGRAGSRMRGGAGGMAGGLPGGFGQKAAPSADEELESDDRHAGIARRAKGAEGGAGRDSVANGAPDPLLGSAADQAHTLLVMRCNATAKAVPVFGTLLDKQQIALVQARGFKGTAVMGKGYGKKEQLDEALADGTNQITFDFEATPDQLAALVTDLNGRPEEFSSVSYVSTRGGVSLGVWDLAGTREALGQEDDESPYAGAALMTKPARGVTGLKKNGRLGQGDPFGARMLPRRAEVRQQAEGEPPTTAAKGQQSKLLRPLKDAAESEMEGKPGLVEMSREPAEQPSPRQVRKQLQPQMPAAPQAKLPEPAKAGEKAIVASEEAYQDEMQSEEEDEAELEEGIPQRARKTRRVAQTPAQPSSRQPAELHVPTERAGQPARSDQAGKRDHIVAKYRVRFVLQILGPETSAAAAVAGESAEAGAPAEKAARMADPDKAPPADKAKPATADP